MPDGKPWLRTADQRDPSQGVLLDLQEDCDWKMDSTVMLPNIDHITAFDDNMQVQCLQSMELINRSGHIGRYQKSQPSELLQDFHLV